MVNQAQSLAVGGGSTGSSGVGVGSGGGLLQVASNATLEALERQKSAEEQRQAEPEISGLVAYVQAVFQENRSHRETERIDEELLQSFRQRAARYSPQKLASIEEIGGTDVYASITGVKCRAAEAWIIDILGSQQSKPWRLKPTPNPDLPGFVVERIAKSTMSRVKQALAQTGEVMPPEQVQAMAQSLREEIENAIADEAKARAEKMEKTIHDQMVEGDFEKVFAEVITDMITFKLGILKGPVVHNSTVLQWSRETGQHRPVLEPKMQVGFDRVSPLDFFPSPNSDDPQDGNLVERHKYTRKDLAEMKGIPGWNENAINAVLLEHGAGFVSYHHHLDSERSALELKGDLVRRTRDTIEGLEFWGTVQGKMLIDKGITKDMEGNTLKPINEYEVNLIVIGRYLVYAMFNPHPMARRPYHTCPYEVIPGSIWGRGIPELIRDNQDICNAAVRALVNNVGIASGPQVSIEDVGRLPPGQNITRLYPWKIWLWKNRGNNSQQKAMDFFQPKSNAGELFAIYENFAKLCDDYSGIPAYAYGNERISGAGRTASGLNMLMTSAARGIKKVMARIDKRIISSVVRQLYEFNMLYNPDESIKGDVQIEPVGILAMLLREQLSAKHAEALQLTSNPQDAEILGLVGRAGMLRDYLESLEMNAERVPPDDVIAEKELAMRKRQEQMQAMEAAK